MPSIRLEFKNDQTIDSITNTKDENIHIQQRQVSGVDSRRNSTLLGISQLEGIIEEESEEDFSKCTQLADDRVSSGKDVFGFRTPKKSGTMALKAMEEISRTPKTTPTSKRGTTPRTPRSGNKHSLLVTPNKVGTPGRRSGNSTPTRGILKSSEKKRPGPTTPMSTRKKVRKTLIQINENIETNRFSDSENDSGSGSGSSDEEEEENQKPIIGPPSTPRTPARRGRPPARMAREVNTNSMADSYFEAQHSRVVTSNRTLSRQNTPRLSEDEVNKLLDKTKMRYDVEIKELLDDHKTSFIRWMSLIHRGYSIITFGLGSKKSLLEDFKQEFLKDSDVLVVNGYFPSLTIRSILDSITDDILDIHTSYSSTHEQIQSIHDSLEEDLYLIIHNIDGPMLRNSKAQTCISQLANHPRVKLLCSIDHINAPLIWDQFMLARFNFVWFDCTTFLPYKEEAAGSNAMMKASGGLQLASIQHVLDALTPGAKKIFILLAKYQIDHQEPHYPGIPFMELYTQCRADFLVTSDLELKAQLTEFRDHKLITSKRGGDGVEYLIIPIDKTTLSGFLESYEG